MRLSVRFGVLLLGGLLGSLYLFNAYAGRGASPARGVSARNQARQHAVRAAMQHAWGGYRRFAFGRDELQPLTQTGNDRWGNWSITLLDSLDTLRLMRLAEYDEAKRHVQHVDFGRSPDGFKVNVFEMIIRALGGLLGAYELDGDPMLLRKADECAQTLVRAFGTPTGLNYALMDVNDRGWTGGSRVSLAEAGTMQLEFKQLARLTGRREYWRMAERVSEQLEGGNRTEPGLYPMFVSVETGQYAPLPVYSVGAHADSFYEYLLKQHLLDGTAKYRARYEAATDAIRTRLVGRTRGGLRFVGRLTADGVLVPEMEHLACFYPGLLALGAQALGRPRDLRLAEELALTCVLAYNSTATGLAPEVAYFTDDARVFEPVDPRYLLRPETVESLFVLYRVTGDPKYQDWGWQIFEAIERHARVAHGYAAVRNVLSAEMAANREDAMESFFLAETLKYLYLLFGPDDVLPLDKYVFTTEAHAFRKHT
ncbi:hypothetical protein LPJ63_004463 [Coemansia sp. RSA 2711]|nr:hypothetical protein LPJ63_004463 [Coemansia sp. RSA 2711]